MKFRINHTVFLRLFSRAGAIADRSAKFPILSHGLLHAEGDEISLTATNLEMWTTTTGPAQVERPGAAALPVGLLLDIIKKMPNGCEIEVTVEPDVQASVRAGRSRFSIGTMPVADFPALDVQSMNTRFPLSADDLRRIIKCTQFAVSTEESRYYLNGIYLHLLEATGVRSLLAVATDGHRLARLAVPAPAELRAMPGIIVPLKMVSEIARLVQDHEDAVTIELSETLIRLGIGQTVLTSKLIDAAFPDYERVIPSNNDKRLDISNKALAAAIDRMAVISGRKLCVVKMSVRGHNITVTTDNKDTGASAVEDVDIVSYTGDELNIGFSARYMGDVLSIIDGSSVRIDIADHVTPIIVTDPARSDFLAIVMPIRV